jgi:hypothetical protein
MVTIFDEDGNELAFGVGGTEAGHRGALTIERIVTGKGRLLGYYFGKGARAVSAEAGGFRLRGTLATEWRDGRRVWWVLLRPAGAPGGVAAATAEASPHDAA